MNLDNIDINRFLERYIEFVNRLSDTYHYEPNIKHLLYLIVPAFVIKYDIKNEGTILKCFEEVPIKITGTENKLITASFSRILRRNNNGYDTIKFILLNEYKTADFLSMFDNIVHEYNHAVNSINNEISYDDKNIRVRTGISHILYNRSDLSFIRKSDEVALEEIINTYQSSEIINIINSFNKYHIDNIEFKHALEALKNEIGQAEFNSEAYGFDSFITKELITNKTFIPTVCNLRFKGLIDEVPYLFDNVLNRTGEYNKLNKLLTEVHELEFKYAKATIFKNMILNEIRNKSQIIINLIKEYDDKCIYR